MPRSEVLPRPVPKFGSSFLLLAHRCSASGTTTSGTRSSPGPVNSPKMRLSEGSPNGWRYVGRKEETQLKSDGRKSEWKTSSMEGEGNGDGQKYGRKCRTPEPIPIAGNSPSEEEMGHWTPTGVEPKDYDDDDK